MTYAPAYRSLVVVRRDTGEPVALNLEPADVRLFARINELFEGAACVRATDLRPAKLCGWCNAPVCRVCDDCTGAGPCATRCGC